MDDDPHDAAWFAFDEPERQRLLEQLRRQGEALIAMRASLETLRLSHEALGRRIQQLGEDLSDR